MRKNAIATSTLILDMVLDLMHDDFFSMLDGSEIDKNIILFCADMSSSVHIGNKENIDNKSLGY